ncbi:hypothetical protein [Inquilinus sp.]|uniref:ribosome modulation factor n=1 Tax=Inquilinus sp. TaxID=1932117 RepID=UPI0031DC64C6
MARRLKEATDQPKRGVNRDVVISYDRKIGEAQSRLDDARGEVGQFNKQFNDIGGNTQALKLARKLKRMEPVKAQAFWKELNQYVGDLQVFAQADMFDDNTITPADTAAAEKRNEVAEAQGKQAGLDGANLDSNPYAEDDPARPFWANGWREGQNELAGRFAAPGAEPAAQQVESTAAPETAPAAEAATEPAADPLEIPPFLDRRPGAAARRRSGRAPAVPTVQ